MVKKKRNSKKKDTKIFENEVRKLISDFIRGAGSAGASMDAQKQHILSLYEKGELPDLCIKELLCADVEKIVRAERKNDSPRISSSGFFECYQITVDGERMNLPNIISCKNDMGEIVDVWTGHATLKQYRSHVYDIVKLNVDNVTNKFHKKQKILAKLEKSLKGNPTALIHGACHKRIRAETEDK